MSLLVHPHPMSLPRPEPLRLLQPRPVSRRAALPVVTAPAPSRGLGAWADRQFTRLAEGAEPRAARHRLGSWMIVR